MKVTVSYFGQLKSITGVSSEVVELPSGSGVVSCVQALAVRHGAAFAAIALAPGGGLRPSLLVTRNGVMCARDNTVLLAEADQVVLLAAIAGG